MEELQEPPVENRWLMLIPALFVSSVIFYLYIFSANFIVLFSMASAGGDFHEKLISLYGVVTTAVATPLLVFVACAMVPSHPVKGSLFAIGILYAMAFQPSLHPASLGLLIGTAISVFIITALRKELPEESFSFTRVIGLTIAVGAQVGLFIVAVWALYLAATVAIGLFGNVMAILLFFPLFPFLPIIDIILNGSWNLALLIYLVPVVFCFPIMGSRYLTDK